MCLICVDFQRERMTILEARRALGEMTEKIGDEHAREVEEMLHEAAQAKERDAASSKVAISGSGPQASSVAAGAASSSAGAMPTS